jgi:anti-anti-sigma factor
MKMAVEPVAPGVVKVILDGRLGVVVDLSCVSFLASIGIRTLLLGAKAVQRRGGCFILLNPVDEVQRVLEVMGMTDLMPIFRDSEAALAVACGQA